MSCSKPCVLSCKVEIVYLFAWTKSKFVEYLHQVPNYCNSLETFLNASLTIKYIFHIFCIFWNLWTANVYNNGIIWQGTDHLQLQGFTSIYFKAIQDCYKKIHFLPLTCFKCYEKKIDKYMLPHMRFLFIHYKLLLQLTHDNVHLEIFWKNVKRIEITQ